MEIIEPGHTRANCRTLETAIRNEFDIPDVVLKQAPIIMAKIMKDGSNREKIAASRVIVAMQNSNQPNVQAHLHQHQAANPEAVQEMPVGDMNLEEQRRRNSERITRLERLGRIG